MEMLIHCRECKTGKMEMEITGDRVVITENQWEVVFTLACDNDECGNKKAYSLERM